jgi:phiEco32-like amidoligase-type 2 protein
MIQLGSDPEIMAFTEMGAVVPAWTYLPREPSPKANDDISVYWDGVQAEISTPPAPDAMSLVRFVRAGLQRSYSELQRSSPRSFLGCRDVVTLPEETLRTAADEHVILGCAPSDNVYGIPPISIGEPREHRLRYSGCHLHFSTDAELPAWWPSGVVVTLDRVLGLALTSLGRGLEDPRRRVAYGRPGEFRVHGSRLEYRAPGSFLLANPLIFRFAVELGRQAFKLGLQHSPASLGLPAVEDAMMQCDADWASTQLERHRDLFTPLIGLSSARPNVWWDALLRGASPAGMTNKSIADAWHLK